VFEKTAAGRDRRDIDMTRIADRCKGDLPQLFWRIAVDGQSAVDAAKELGITANAARLVKMIKRQARQNSGGTCWAPEVWRHQLHCQLKRSSSLLLEALVEALRQLQLVGAAGSEALANQTKKFAPHPETGAQGAR